jgi:hypothetical protein
MDYEYVYKLCTKYCLYVNNYKIFHVVETEVMTDKFNIDKINAHVT